jgi:uncharacterized membrane protein
MAPLITLVFVTVLARFAGQLGIGGDSLKTWSGALRPGAAAMFVLTGSVHFVWLREDLMKMVPPMFGDPGFWVTLTGIAEIAGALGLLLPKTRRAAAIGILLLLVAVTPANIYAAMHELRVGGESAPPLLLRLPEQLLYLAAVALAGFGPPRARAPRHDILSGAQ